MDIDRDALALSQKILIVAFIIITIVINAEYLFRYVRASKVMSRAGHFGKIRLALGNIFLALFSYVVQAKIYFDDPLDLTTCTWVIASVYMLHFLPFVFGMSIAVIWFMWSSTIGQRSGNTKPRSLLIAMIPWLVGLPLIFSIALAGVDLSNCVSGDYNVIWPLTFIGIIVPACIALLISIVLFIQERSSTRHLSSTAHNSWPDNLPTSHGTHLAVINVPATTQTADHTPQQPFKGIPVEPQSQQTPPQYPQQPWYPPPIVQQFHPQTLHTAPMNSYAFDNDLTPHQIMKEKRGLLFASLIFFLSVFPLACFILYTDATSYEEFAYDSSTRTIIGETCRWVFCLYPVLIPIIWRSQVQM